MQRMPRGIGPFALAAAVILLNGTQSTDAQGMTAAEALRTVKKTGKPLFVVASSPTCGPCLRLKSVIHSDPKVKSILDDFVYLEMDSKSADFAQFRATYPGSYSGVPMVYMLRADGEVMYGQSGGMPTEQLQMLLDHGLKNAGNVLSATELQQVEQAFSKGRTMAEQGKLVDAFDIMSRIVSLGGFAEVVYSAQKTQQELSSLLANWTAELDQSIASGESVHANAYRLAELYVELPETATLLRANIKRVLDHYEAQDRTGNAIRQNKRLVRARLEESREACDAAVASYQYVIGLGASSPAGEFAKQRLAVVAKKQKLKVSTNN